MAFVNAWRLVRRTFATVALARADRGVRRHRPAAGLEPAAVQALRGDPGHDREAVLTDLADRELERQRDVLAPLGDRHSAFGLNHPHGGYAADVDLVGLLVQALRDLVGVALGGEDAALRARVDQLRRRRRLLGLDVDAFGFGVLDVALGALGPRRVTVGQRPQQRVGLRRRDTADPRAFAADLLVDVADHLPRVADPDRGLPDGVGRGEQPVGLLRGPRRRCACAPRCDVAIRLVDVGLDRLEVPARRLGRLLRLMQNLA